MKLKKNNYHILKILVFLLLAITFNYFESYAQDTIIKFNNEKIKCKIIQEDSIKIIYRITESSYNFNEENDYIEKTILIKDVKEIKRKYVKPRNVLPIDKSSFGLGLGLDYGGIGANLLLYPAYNFGVFGGIGNNLNGVGYNAGIKLRLVNTNSRAFAVPYFSLMYGYNTTIDAGKYINPKNTFYGYTLGFGLDFLSDELPQNYLTFSILYPFREEYDKYIDNLKKSWNNKVNSSVMPILFSIGYRFSISTF